MDRGAAHASRTVPDRLSFVPACARWAVLPWSVPLRALRPDRSTVGDSFDYPLALAVVAYALMVVIRAARDGWRGGDPQVFLTGAATALVYVPGLFWVPLLGLGLVLWTLTRLGVGTVIDANDVGDGAVRRPVGETPPQ
jgi:hypothetical protein